jgi:hypothetical protein
MDSPQERKFQDWVCWENKNNLPKINWAIPSPKLSK